MVVLQTGGCVLVHEQSFPTGSNLPVSSWKLPQPGNIPQPLAIYTCIHSSWRDLSTAEAKRPERNDDTHREEHGVVRVPMSLGTRKLLKKGSW